MEKQTTVDMDDESDGVTATLLPTKGGKGIKLKVDGVNWLYASKRNVRQMMQGVRPSVVFSEITDD